MLRVNDEIVVKNDKGETTAKVPFSKPVVRPGEFLPTDGESDADYGKRIRTLLAECNASLADWTGRSEADKLTRKGVEGCLNMGMDLALRQVNRPKKASKTQNRKAAITWAIGQTAQPNGKIGSADVVANAARLDAWADELVAKYGNTIPGVSVDAE